MNNNLSFLVSLFFLLPVFLCNSQSSNHNYIKSIEILEPVSIGTFNTNPSSVDKIESVTYYDGFGKAKQQIGIKQSANQKDVVQHMEYDQFGRAIKQYLPLPSTQITGNFITNAQSQITTFYQNNFSDQHPFSEVRYDNSPLNRKLESSAPGNTWELLSASDADHTSKYDYGYNTTDEVLLFEIDEFNTITPLTFTHYPSGELLKNIVKNENWATTDGLLNTKEVFTDKSGKKIAEFSYEEDGGNPKKLSTYYVYDDRGNLRYILPPKLIDNVNTGPPTYNNYSTSWPVNDFLEQGNAGTTPVTLNITNNILTISSSGKSRLGTPASQLLNLQTTKPLNTSSVIPDVYLGIVQGTVEFLGSFTTVDLGDASIINGNLVVDRYYVSYFVDLKISLSLDLGTLASGVNQNDLDDLAFQYNYDVFNRQIEQKVPGKGWEYMVYDQLDRPILTQDANLKLSNEWMFIKYDAFGRTVYSGLYTNASTRSALQSQVDTFINGSSNKSNIESRTTSTSSIGGVSINYSNNAFPNSSLETLSVNYYDDYNFTDSDKPTTPSSIYGQQVTTRTKGLTTASWAKTLDATSWSKNYTYYDEKGRVIYVYQKNHLGGFTENKSELDFRGKIVESETNHKRLSTSTNLKIVDRFEYDHVERPKKHFQTINTQTEELIAENTYNELGQLQTKSVGNALQTINYTYNIRGWLTKFNDVNSLGTDLFAYTLKYNEALEGTASVGVQYNGNIRQTIWKSAHTNLKQSYAFEYDKLNRFTKSVYRENSSLNGGAGKFETYNLTYDANGNIGGLYRKNQSGTIVDNLIYHYNNGNKLMYIVDQSISDGFNNGITGSSAGDYDYDSNGNLIKDLNKNISNIEYNHLDLVKKITFVNGDKIEFTYDASGAKLQMKNTPWGGSATTVDYLGGFQYTGNTLNFFPIPEGFVVYDQGTYKYLYQLRDHLGNVRVGFRNNGGTPQIVSNTDYYVMGLTHNGDYTSGIASNNNYKYQGKEKLEFSGYNMYDFGSRMYDASVGRWFNTDPQSQFSSPYLAMANNPVMVVDPDGEFAFIPILIGAAVGGMLGGIQADMSGGNFWDGLAKGAIMGAVTAGVGEWVKGMDVVKNIGKGFTNGAVVGGSSGLAGGLTSSSLNGGNFGEIIKGGATGLLIGGAIGGLQSGFSAKSHGGNFWTGDGSTFDVPDLNPDASSQVGGGMEYSTKYGKGYLDYFPDMEHPLEYYADGTVPKGGNYTYSSSRGVFVGKRGHDALAVTQYDHVTKRSNMFFARKAFTSPEQLYLTTGHELLHLAHHSAGLFKGFTRGHASIYDWQYRQAKAWGLMDLARSYKVRAGQLSQFWNRNYNWRNFCIDVCPTKDFLHP